MRLDGKMVLCGRSDADMLRSYSGALTELAIWDQVLTPDQVSRVYDAVRISFHRIFFPLEPSRT